MIFYFIKQKKILFFKIITIYLPTWRDDGKDFFVQSGINLVELNHLMMEENSLFMIKMHPATKLDISELSNILVLDNNVDLYSLLPLTDYSSVFFD